MKPVSLADISYEQGLQLLALHKQALDAGKTQRMPPEALADTFPLRNIAHSYAEKLADDTLLDRLKSGFKGVGGQVQSGLQQGVNQLGEGLQGAKKRWDGLDPAARTALTAGLAGTGLGAATGAVASLRRGDKRVGRGALRGGLMGAAMGGGLGLALTPGLADTIQGKGSQLLNKAQQYAKPETPAAGAAPGAAPAALSGEQTRSLQELARKADSRSPEVIAGVGAAATLAGGGLGAKYVNNRTSYNVNDLADHLWTKAQHTAKPGTPGNLDAVAFSRMMGESPGMAAMKHKDTLDKIRKGVIGPKDIADAMRGAGHGPTLFGNMRESTRKAVSNAVGSGGLQDALDASKSRGLRRGGLLGTALATLTGLGLNRLNYQHNNLARTEAEAALPITLPPKP